MEIVFKRKEVQKIMEPHSIENVMEQHVRHLFATETHKEMDLPSAEFEVDEKYDGTVTVKIIPNTPKEEDAIS